jgi:hypothetical protein
VASFIPSGPVFPPEITDLIIHQFSPNFPALRICSLVCRAWVPASHYILYETLSLRGEDILDFLEIIEPAENTYFAGLRALDLSLCENGPTASLVVLFPRFHSLAFIRVSSSIFHYEFPIVSSVTTLEFLSVQFRSFAAFTNLLSRVPNLKKLEFEKVSWGSADGWAPARTDITLSKPTHRLRLDTLSIQVSNDPHFLDWLSCEESGPLTQNLTLLLPRMPVHNAKDSEMFHRVSEYLRHLNVSLKRLFIRFGDLS